MPVIFTIDYFFSYLSELFLKHVYPKTKLLDINSTKESPYYKKFYLNIFLISFPIHRNLQQKAYFLRKSFQTPIVLLSKKGFIRILHLYPYYHRRTRV